MSRARCWLGAPAPSFIPSGSAPARRNRLAQGLRSGGLLPSRPADGGAARARPAGDCRRRSACAASPIPRRGRRINPCCACSGCGRTPVCSRTGRTYPQARLDHRHPGLSRRGVSFLDQSGRAAASSSAAFIPFIIRGTWVKEKASARICSPGTRKSTHTASGCVRQTSSFANATSMKKRP